MTIAQRLERAYLRLHQALYERSGGWVGHRMTGTRSLLLRTTGRRTGQARTSALIYGRDGDRYVVVASNHGREQPPAWQLNIEADPHVELQVARHRYRGTARVVEASEPDHARLWAVANVANHDRYRGYQATTATPAPSRTPPRKPSRAVR